MQHTGPSGTLHLPPAGSTSSMHTSSSSSSMAAGPFTHHGWSHSPMTAANTAATAAAAAAAAGSAAYMVPQSMQQQTMSMNYSGMNLPMTTAAMPVTPPYGSSGSGGSSGISRHVTNMPVGVLADTDSRKPRGRSGPKSKFSPFIGVSQYKRTGRWEAHIWDSSSSTRGSRVSGGKAGKGKQLHLGSFLTAAQAARAYDRAALLLRGPNAALNFPLEEYSNDPVLEELSHMSRTELVLALRKTCDMELEAAALEAFHAKVPAAAAHLLHNITGPAPSGTNTMTPPPAAAAAGDVHFGGAELLPQMQPWQQQQQQMWLQHTHAEPLDPISGSPLPAAAAAAAAMQGDLPMHEQPWTGSTPTAALLQMPGNAVGTPFATTAAAAAVHQAEQQQQQQHSVPDLVPMGSAPAGHSAPLLPQQQQQQQHGVSAASPLHPHLSAPSPLSYGRLAAADSPSPFQQQQQQQQQQAMYHGMSGLPTAESAPVPLSFEYSLDHHHHDAIFQQQQQQQVHSQGLSLQTNASAPLPPISYMQQQQQQQTSAPDTAYYQRQEHNGPARQQQQQGDDVLLPVLPPAWSSPLPWSNYPQDQQQQHPMKSHDVNVINNNHKLQGPRPHQDNQPGTSPDKIQAYQACQAHQAGLGPDKIQADQAHQARSQMMSSAVVFGYESPTAADTAMADRINQPAAAAALKGNAQQYGTANPVPIPAAAAADNAPAGRHQMPRSSPWQVTLEDESSTSSSGPSRGSSSGSDQQHLRPLHRQQQQQQRMHSTAMQHYGQMHQHQHQQQQQQQQQRPGSARCSVAGSSSSSLVGRSGAKGTVVLPVANNSGSPCIAPAATVAAAAHGHEHAAAVNARDLHHASSTKVPPAAAAAVAPEQESIGRRSTAGSNSTGILFSPTILPGGKQQPQQQQQQWGMTPLPDEQHYYHHHHQQQQQHGRWHPGQVHPATTAAAAAAVPVSTAATAAAGWPQQQQQHVLSPYVYSTENAVPGTNNTATTAVATAAAAVGGGSKGGNLTPRHMTSHDHVISPFRDVSDDWANLLNPSPSTPKDHQQQSSDLVECDRDHHHHHQQQQQQQQLDSDVILYTKPRCQAASTRPSSTSPAAAAAAADVPLTFRPSATPPQSPHNTAATAAAAAAATLAAVTHSQQQQQGQSADNTPAAAAAAGLERTISNITLSNIPPSRTVSSLVMAELARLTSGCPGSGDHHDTAAAAAAAAAASDLIMMECQHVIYHQHSLPGLEQLDNLLMTNQQISNPVMTNQQISNPAADHQISDHTEQQQQQQQQRVREYNSILSHSVKNDKHELPHLVPVAVSGPPAAATAAAAAAAAEADMSVSGLGQNASGGKRGITDGNNIMDEEVDMPAAKRPRSPVIAAAVRSVTDQMHRQDGSVDGNASAATAAGHSHLHSPERLGWWEMMQY